MLFRSTALLALGAITAFAADEALSSFLSSNTALLAELSTATDTSSVLMDEYNYLTSVATDPSFASALSAFSTSAFGTGAAASNTGTGTNGAAATGSTTTSGTTSTGTGTSTNGAAVATQAALGIAGVLAFAGMLVA